MLWLPLPYLSYRSCRSLTYLEQTGTVISAVSHASAGRQHPICREMEAWQSRAEDSRVFDGSCELQLLPANRYPWAPLLPWLCFPLIMLCFYWSVSVNRAPVITYQRLDPPQTESQKSHSAFPEPYILSLPLPPSRAPSGMMLSSTGVNEDQREWSTHSITDPLKPVLSKEQSGCYKTSHDWSSHKYNSTSNQASL